MKTASRFLISLWRSVPKSPGQLLVFWLYVHAKIGTKYLSREHPYKDKDFTLEEVALGRYVGYPETTIYSLVLWVLAALLAAYTVNWLA